MTELWSYPKVYNLGHPALAELLDGEVVVQEKVDGSQFSFGVLGGELRLRSKGATIYPDAPDRMFAPAAETAQAIASELKPGWVYRGEFLAKPKHNVLRYGRVPAGSVILFDVERGPSDFAPPEMVRGEADHLGLECVTQFLADSTLDAMAALLDKESCLGGTKVEGIVVKNYARFGRDGKALMGKHVSEDFKEVHRKEWKAANPSTRDVAQRLVEEFRAEGRWAKAVQHLRDAGELENDPRDIGKLIREVQRDLEEEESEYIKEKLLAHFLPGIKRGAAAGVAEWYKQRLFERQFEQ